MDKLYLIKPLKGFGAFKDVFEKGRSKSTAKLTLTIEFGKSDILMLGVGISKKRCKKAVTRNRIKRLLRESIRQINKETDLPENISRMTAFWKYSPEHPKLIKLEEIKSEIKLLLKKFKSQIK